MFYLYILIFIASCLLLVKSGTWVVSSLTRIAKSLGWKEFIVSFILMAFVTSLPEFFVGISSAFHSKPELSFGDILGSNIINLTLAVAIVVLLAKGLKCKTSLIRQSSIYTAIIAFLPILLMLDGKISRIDGLFLVFILIFYFKYLFKEQKRFSKVFTNRFKRDWTEFKLFSKDLGIFLGGIFLLLLSAEGVVWSVSFFAISLGLSLTVIGALIVALGTNLPEIVFGIKAITMGHKDMVLGTLMGSVVANSTLVLGTVVLIHPLKVVNFSPYIIGIIFTVATCLFFAVFSRTGRKITRKEAVVLLAIYILFVVFQLVIR
jgi:cation:H+ antiporter